MNVQRAQFLKLVTALAGGAACTNTAPPAHQPQIAREVSAPAVTADASPPAAPASTGQPPPLASSLPPVVDPTTSFTCRQIRCPTGPTTEGMRELMATCKTIETRLTPDRFQHFMQCMMAHNNTRSTCDLMLIGTDPGECLDGWADVTTLAPDATQVCAPIVRKCGAKGLSPQSCQQMISSASSTGRRKMVACVTEYCDEAEKLCHGGFG